MVVSSLTEIGRIITAAWEDTITWEEIKDLLEHKRRLAEAERKRLVEMRQMVTAERLTVMMAAVAGVIQDHVTDPRLLSAIADDLRALAGGGVYERGS